MTTISHDYQDMTFDSIQEYFGEDISLEDLAEMSAEERQALFEQLISSAGLSDDQISAFEDAFTDELDDFYSTLYTYYKELSAIMDSGNITVAEEASIELIQKELEEWMTIVDENISDDWGSGLDSFNDKNITVAANNYYEFDSSGATQDAVYNIDASAEADLVTGSSQFDCEGSESGTYADLNSNGVLEEGENLDTDADGEVSMDELIASGYDADGDGLIEETDNPQYQGATNGSTVDLNLEATDTVYLTSYEEGDPPTATLQITKEDGTSYYVKVTGDCKIICTGQALNLDSWPSDLLNRVYETSSSTDSYAAFTSTGDSATEEAQEAYTYVDMNQQATDTYQISPSSEDFADERAYTIVCQDGTSDNIDIYLSAYPDAEITFSSDGHGNTIMTVTCSEGTITITFEGLEYSDDGVGADSIDITGGTISESANESYLNSAHAGAVGGSGYKTAALYDMISHDGVTLRTEAENKGWDDVAAGRWIYFSNTAPGTGFDGLKELPKDNGPDLSFQPVGTLEKVVIEKKEVNEPPEAPDREGGRD